MAEGGGEGRKREGRREEGEGGGGGGRWRQKCTWGNAPGAHPTIAISTIASDLL